MRYIQAYCCCSIAGQLHSAQRRQCQYVVHQADRLSFRTYLHGCFRRLVPQDRCGSERLPGDTPSDQRHLSGVHQSYCRLSAVRSSLHLLGNAADALADAFPRPAKRMPSNRTTPAGVLPPIAAPPFSRTTLPSIPIVATSNLATSSASASLGPFSLPPPSRISPPPPPARML